jgi:transcription-repair coupling factor (superfamily II helicase)
MIDRYASIFRDANLPVQQQFPLNAAPTSNQITLTASSFRHGFRNEDFIFITERDLTGSQSSGQ